jgi:ATP-binding cassette, subfamily B (MDR/TAP), member 1
MGADSSEKALAAPPSGRASSHGDSTKTRSQTQPTPKRSADLEKADSKVILPKEPTDADPFKHLPEREAEILKSQVLTPDAKVGIATLYRYASRNDLIVVAISALAAIASGAALPLMTVIFGNLQGTFQGYFQLQITYDDFRGELTTLVLYFVYLAIGEFVCTYVATVGFIYTGEHVSAKIREHYLESCMKQNIAFFDKLGAGEVTTRITRT